LTAGAHAIQLVCNASGTAAITAGAQLTAIGTGG
jgi:hypothetical protein